MPKITKIYLVFLSIFLSFILAGNVLMAYSCADQCGDYGVGSSAYETCMTECSGTGGGAANPTTDSSGGAANPASGGSVSLGNPLGSITNPQDIIKNVINAMLTLVGSLALAVFIYGGFTWVTSAGNDEKIKKGRDMILWASLGLMLIFASYAIIQFVLGAVTG